MTLWPLYRALTIAAGPAITFYLRRRRRRGREHPSRHLERQGYASLARPDGPLVWLHGASVGESLALLPLVERLLALDPGLRALVTSGTVASSVVLVERLPARACHQFVPVDRPAAVGRFLDHWRPDLAIWIESELWPNLVLDTKRRGIAMALINARMSARSLQGWARVPRSAAGLLACFDLVLAQDDAQAARLRQLRAEPIVSVGDLKFAGGPPPDQPNDRASLARLIGGRPVWLAASTHPGEERLIAEAHRMLRVGHPSLLTIIVPRHPARGQEIARDLAPAPVARRCAGEEPGPRVQIYVADTMGELGIFYRLCRVAFVGGSLVPMGGHNLLEPGWLGCAILHGPHIENTASVAAALSEAEAAIEVSSAAELAAAVDRLLRDEPFCRQMGERARSVAEGRSHVLDQIVALLAPLLPASPADREVAARCARHASGTVPL